MAVSEQLVKEALQSVREPEHSGDIVALNQIRSIKVFEGTVSVEVSSAAPAREKLRQDIVAAVSKIAGVEEVFVSFAASLGTAAPPAQPGQHSAHAHAGGGPGAKPAPRGLPGVKQIVAVGAGKGGVGKSTIAVNLAIGLALAGKKVALLDGDIYGPSIPTLTGISPRPPEIAAERIIPFTISAPASLGKSASIAVMSIGFMVDKEKALIWRGPMAHGAMKQMLEQVVWTHGIEAAGGGEQPALDYLIVDLPPGTGDVSLTLAQTVPLTGAVIVATPQEVALADARRAVRMFQQLGVEILGVVENMSYFVCDHGSEYDIFGRGGAQAMARQMGLPFLGAVPIDTSLRENSDAGKPFGNFDPKSPSCRPLSEITDMLDKQVAVRLVTRPAAKALNLTIS